MTYLTHSVRRCRALPGLVALFMAAAAAAETPLLMDGKTSLYQRVLLREAVARHSAPDKPEAAMLRPLQAFYVYAREGDWLKVAPDEAGGDLFYVPAAAAIDWKQNIVATFEGSENLGRVMFFDGFDSAYDLVEAEDPAAAAVPLRAEAEAAEAGGAPSEKVIALGPRTAVDLQENLYVMPILSAEEAVFENGSFVNLLEVAVARADSGGDPKVSDPSIVSGPGEPLEVPEDIRNAYRVGVVFVVDTTISMQPYIDATRAALEDVYAHVAAGTGRDVVSFGLIGFRDNVTAVPELEYVAKTFVTLQDGYSGEAFQAGIKGMTEAKKSSRNFREDSFAGVELALEAMDWSGFGGRFIVLVTDAGPRLANDELSSTGLSAEGLNSLVKERLNAAIVVMHLRSPAGAEDHARAEAAYKALASLTNGSPLYFGIAGGDTGTYRETARRVGQLIVDQVASFRSGAPIAPPVPSPEVEADAPGAIETVASAGRTMQLAWLGSQTSERAPDVFQAVVADRDFARTGLKPLSIRVLLTKSDLSDLQEALKIIIRKAEENVIDPDKFFEQVLGAAADMSRNPEKVSRRSAETIAEAAAIDEFIEDLPYKSRIMAISEDDWLRMSISEQQTVVNELIEKVERYSRYNEATDSWVDVVGTGLDGGALVYPMKLDDLP
jgi:serine/threonine-protein kinase PpkA